MPRKKIERRVCCQAPFECFKPNGVPMRNLESVQLAADELEAIRLVDFDGLQQIEAAKEMEVSRQTFALILKSARKKVSSCLLQGKVLMLERKNDINP